MAKRNLTVQLDDSVITHAKVAAARRGLSLSALVAQQLVEMSEADERYERAKAVALAAMENAVDRQSVDGGTPAWRREDLYGR